MQGTTSSNNLYTKLESVEAVDDMTVKMVLINPNLDWPYMMTIPTTSILSEKAVTDDPTEGTGIGTGPWQIDSYELETIRSSLHSRTAGEALRTRRLSHSAIFRKILHV